MPRYTSLLHHLMRAAGVSAMASSATQRGVTAILEGIVRRLWGFPPRLLGEIVADLGPLRALAWVTRNMPRYQRTFRVFGALRTHLMCFAISLVNDCRYCAHGDGLGLQLAYLRDHGRLFPLGERASEALCGQSPALIRHRLTLALHRAGLHGEVPWLDRTMTLAVTGPPVATEPRRGTGRASRAHVPHAEPNRQHQRHATRPGALPAQQGDLAESVLCRPPAGRADLSPPRQAHDAAIRRHGSHRRPVTSRPETSPESTGTSKII